MTLGSYYFKTTLLKVWLVGPDVNQMEAFFTQFQIKNCIKLFLIVVII